MRLGARSKTHLVCLAAAWAALAPPAAVLAQEKPAAAGAEPTRVESHAGERTRVGSHAQETTRTGRRNLIWDRARLRADLERRKAEIQRELLNLMATHGARHPRVVETRQRFDALARQIEEMENPAAGQHPVTVFVLEKAAYLGVAASQATPVLQKHLKLPDGTGLVVDFIEPGSPAETAGLQVYDVLVRLDGQLLINPQQLAVLVRTFDPGAEVKLRLIREGEPSELGVRLVEREVKRLEDVEFWDADAAVAVDSGVERPTQGIGELPPPMPLDRAIEPGSTIHVVVSDLMGPGIDTTASRSVTADGLIRLPFLEAPVQAAGLTQLELQGAIVKAYRLEGVQERAAVEVGVSPPGSEPAEPAPVTREPRRPR